jgi:hypothetical protein
MPDPIPARNYADLPLNERLDEAHRILDNLHTHPDLGPPMGLYGYGPEAVKLTQADALYAAARAAFDEQADALGDKRVATQDVAEAYALAYAAYRRLAGIARAAFEDDPATLDALGIGDFPDGQVDRYEAFRRLEQGAREPARLAAFAEYEVDAADFDAFDALVDDYDEALHAADASRGSAEHRTAQKGSAMEALDGWVGKMQKVARVALREHRQLLELVGLRVPS